MEGVNFVSSPNSITSSSSNRTIDFLEKFQKERFEGEKIDTLFQNSFGRLFFTGTEKPGTIEKEWRYSTIYTLIYEFGKHSVIFIKHPPGVSDWYKKKGLGKAHLNSNRLASEADQSQDRSSFLSPVMTVAELAAGVLLANNPFDSSVIDYFKNISTKRGYTYGVIKTPHERVVKIEAFLSTENDPCYKFFTLGSEGDLFAWDIDPKTRNIRRKIKGSSPFREGGLKFLSTRLSTYPRKLLKEMRISQFYRSFQGKNSLPMTCLFKYHGERSYLRKDSEEIITTVPVGRNKVYYDTQYSRPFPINLRKRLFGSSIRKMNKRISKIVYLHWRCNIDKYLVAIQKGLPEHPFDKIILQESHEDFVRELDFSGGLECLSSPSAVLFDSIAVMNAGSYDFEPFLIFAGRSISKDGSAYLFVQSAKNKQMPYSSLKGLKTRIITNYADNSPARLVNLENGTFLLTFYEKYQSGDEEHKHFYIYWMGEDLTPLDHIRWENTENIEQEMWFAELPYYDGDSSAIFINPSLMASSSKGPSSPFVFRKDAPSEKKLEEQSEKEESEEKEEVDSQEKKSISESSSEIKAVRRSKDRKDSSSALREPSPQLPPPPPGYSPPKEVSAPKEDLGLEIQEIKREIVKQGKKVATDEEIRSSIGLIRVLGEYTRELVEVSIRNRQNRVVKEAIQALLFHKNKNVSEYYKNMRLTFGSMLLVSHACFPRILKVRQRVSFDKTTAVLNAIRLGAKGGKALGKLISTPLVSGLIDLIGSAVEEGTDEAACRRRDAQLEKLARFCEYSEIDPLAEGVARALTYVNMSVIETTNLDISKLTKEHAQKLIKSIIFAQKSINTLEEKVEFLVNSVKSNNHSRQMLKQDSNFDLLAIGERDKLVERLKKLETEVQSLKKQLEGDDEKQDSSEIYAGGNQVQLLVSKKLHRSRSRIPQEGLFSAFEGDPVASLGIELSMQSERMHSLLEEIGRLSSQVSKLQARKEETGKKN